MDFRVFSKVFIGIFQGLGWELKQKWKTAIWELLINDMMALMMDQLSSKSHEIKLNKSIWGYL